MNLFFYIKLYNLLQKKLVLYFYLLRMHKRKLDFERSITNMLKTYVSHHLNRNVCLFYKDLAWICNYYKQNMDLCMIHSLKAPHILKLFWFSTFQESLAEKLTANSYKYIKLYRIVLIDYLEQGSSSTKHVILSS